MTTNPLKSAVARLALVCATFVASPGLAADIALVIGNEDYDAARDLSRGDAVVTARDELQDGGIDVISRRNAELSDVQSALAQFIQMAPNADGLLVVLSGRFLHSSTDTYFLPVDSDRPGLARLNAQSVPLSAVLAVLATRPERAMLLLGTDNEGGAVDPFLTAGLDSINVPPGVTVIRGAPRALGGFLRNTVAVPGASIPAALDRERSLRGVGHLPEGYSFLTATRPADPAEAGYWDLVQELDTANAYRRYLDRYPNGPNAAEAQRRIDAIASEPNRQARLEEEALNLNREQRQNIQRALTILNYNPRGIDGIFGPGTRGAVTRWQGDNGFRQTSYLNAAQINRLAQQGEARAAELEAQAEAERIEQERRDRAWWDQTGRRGGEANFRAYLERYPDGLYAEIATARLAAIDNRNRDRAEARDRLAWERANDEDTLEGYRFYIQRFPNGVFANEAEARIAAIEEADRNAALLAQARAREEALRLNPITRQLVERRLNALGLKPGRVDGDFDERTRRAIRRFQDGRNLQVTGYLDEPTMVRLLTGGILSLFE